MQAYYGGDQHRWLNMPMRVLSAYADAMDRRQAEDNLNDAQVVGVGSGNITKQDRKTILSSWTREARPPSVMTTKSQVTPEEREAMMSRVGIQVG